MGGGEDQGILGKLADPILGNPEREAAKQQRKDATQAIDAALQKMSPENINALFVQFFPMIMQRASPLFQTQQQGLQSSLAQRGLGESGVGATAAAGLRGMQANNAVQQAFQQATNMAGNQARIIQGGMPQITAGNQMLFASPSGHDQLEQGSRIFSNAMSGAGGMSALAAMSASRFKENFEDVSTDDILASVESLPVYRWSYKGDSARHIGPMAEDFKSTFSVGDSEDMIYFVDALGTLMAATQALASRVKKLEADNARAT
jgi:hypothetical protein